MNSFRLLLLAGTALNLSSGPAFAQSAPSASSSPASPPPAQADKPDAPAPAQEETTTIQDVVVAARPNDIRTSIDSISYSVANDLQAATGSLADMLRNVPSVDVDPQGNVSLRGDPGVTILIDGQPSGLLSGDGRAQALLQLPADQYSRVEVMTNPSAAYRPDGSGGIINLITKPAVVRPGATVTGSVRANVGEDRYNLGASATWTRDRLTLSGDVSLRVEDFAQTIDRVRERLDAGSGQFLESRQAQNIDAASDGVVGRLTATYKATDKTQLTGELRLNDFGNAVTGLEAFEGENAAGVVTQAYRRDSVGGFDGRILGATGRIVHKFDDQGHEWSGELRLDRFSMDIHQSMVTDVITPVGADVFEAFDNHGLSRSLGFTTAYVRPMADNAKLRLGYDLDVRVQEMENILRRGPAPDALVLDPLLTNRFDIDRTVQAVYGTYERPFGELTAQFGLRLEHTAIEIDQVTTGARATNDLFRAYPTLHLSYPLTDEQTLRASYSRRVLRPQPADLNPFPSYQDPFNYRSGNPDLEPQETHSWELIWQRRVEQTFYQATLYYRDTTNAFTEVATHIGDGVFVTRPENLGARQDVGLELTANGNLHPTLRYSVSVNLFHQEIDTATLVNAQDRSGTLVSGRASLNWQPTLKDFLQLSGLWQGDSMQAQSVREAGGMINVGYRRKLTDTVSLQATVRDLFDDFGDITFIDTPTFRERTERIIGGRSWYVGLTWAFGQGPRRQEPQFDFSAPGGG